MRLLKQKISELEFFVKSLGAELWTTDTTIGFTIPIEKKKSIKKSNLQQNMMTTIRETDALRETTEKNTMNFDV